MRHDYSDQLDAQRDAMKSQQRFECLQEIAGAVTVAAIIAGITILFIMVASS